jgi:hypothetical protein
MANLELINKVIKTYFEKNSNIQKILAKDLMPNFINAGIFEADHRNGLPIRKVLRDLDSKNKLSLIPYVLAERKSVNTNWYFVNVAVSSNSSNSVIKEISSTQKKTGFTNKVQRDEHYILDLCDEILGTKGIRQHRFEFLKGDSGTKLPVDAYYPSLNLVIEFKEKQHTEEVKFFDKRETVSGVGRGEQRKIYDQRRRDILPQHGINLIEFDYSEFEHTSGKKLIRNKMEDVKVIKTKLGK